MHYLLIFFIFETSGLAVIDFDHLDSCKTAGEALMKEFDEEPDANGHVEHNSFYHCVEK